MFNLTYCKILNPYLAKPRGTFSLWNMSLLFVRKLGHHTLAAAIVPVHSLYSCSITAKQS